MASASSSTPSTSSDRRHSGEGAGAPAWSHPTAGTCESAAAPPGARGGPAGCAGPCVGLNYRDHAEETGAALPRAPLLFAKWPNTLIGSGDAIVLPEESHEVDYEAELGVVIGATVRGVSEADALDTVRGYICLNDVSARDLQFGDGQWTRGKSPDTFCPVGPRLVPREEVPDPQALAIRCILNGETMQDSSTANMIFSVAEIIAYISRTITLEPGDLIATGTPAGVGVFRDPKVLLKDGDEVTVEVERLGALTNPVEKGT
jgi:2-keto-4-pentenoate hydratase/2-oxohepta-3-ene-1,7-dioic acid hydratase in catechol pathway